MIWAIDTEDDSAGNVFLVDFFDGEKHYTFENKINAIKFFNTLPADTIIYAHNLGYDIGNLFDLDRVLENALFVSGSVLSARIKTKNDYVIEFRDSYKIFPTSLEAIGKSINLPKLDSKGQYNNKEYVQRDTEIVYFAIKEFQKTIANLGYKAKLGLTLGATALNIWKKINKNFESEYPFNNNDFILESYYGGRTEVFHLGEFEKDLYYLDFNSMYPYIMKEKSFPIYKDAFYSKKISDFNKYDHGIIKVFVSVKKNIKIPILPYKKESGKLYFPVGDFETVVTFVELKKAIKENQISFFNIISMLIFPHTANPFTNFVDIFWTLRINASNEKDKLIYKLIMNNLYGKFIQHKDGEAIATKEYIEKDKTSKLKVVSKISNTLFLTKTKIIPKYSNYIFSTYITSYARLLLFEAFDIVNNNGVLIYGDTDSIVFQGKKAFEALEKQGMIGSELGKLKLEMQPTYFNAKAPKMYKYKVDGKDSYKVKGVNKNKAKVYRNYIDLQYALKKESSEYEIQLIKNEIVVKTFNKLPKENEIKNESFDYFYVIFYTQKAFFENGIAQTERPLKIKEYFRIRSSKEYTERISIFYRKVKKEKIKPNIWVIVEKKFTNIYDKRKVKKDLSTIPVNVKNIIDDFDDTITENYF